MKKQEGLLFDPPLRKKISPLPDTPLTRAVLHVIHKLKEAGHEAYLVGGSIRDLLLGQQAQDYDIAVSAPPEEVQKLFRRTIPTGIQFGTVTVFRKKFTFEVTTFRSDGRYLDGRRPTSVTFATVKDDVQRRDFTINGLLYDPDKSEILDYVGGIADLEAGLIRTIGDPFQRFGEDRLRMLRAIRFAARFHFEIEAQTFAAIQQMAPRLSEVSAERIHQELVKILRDSSRTLAVELLDKSGLFPHIIPNFTHIDHLIARFELLEKEKELSDPLILALFLLDRPIESVEETLRDLKFSNKIIKKTLLLLQRYHQMSQFIEMSIASQKRFLREPDTAELLRLTEIAWRAHGQKEMKPLEAAQTAFKNWSDEDLRPAPLLNGRYLIKQGYPKGPILAQILKAVEDAQLEGKLTTQEELPSWLQQHFPIDEK